MISVQRSHPGFGFPRKGMGNGRQVIDRKGAILKHGGED